MKGTLYVYHYDDEADPTKVDVGIVNKKKYSWGTEAFWFSNMDYFVTDLSFYRYYKIGPSVLGKW